MVIPFVTTKLTALFIAGLIFLSALVILRRRKTHIALGDGNDAILQRRIRVQGNYVEYVPIFLIGSALFEINGAAAWQVWALGVLMGCGRFVHALSLLYHNGLLRIIGVAGTMTALTLVAIGLFMQP